MEAAKERRLRYQRQLAATRIGTDAYAQAKGFKNEEDRRARMRLAEDHILRQSPVALAAASRGRFTTPDGAVRVLTAAGAQILRQREQQANSVPAPNVEDISEPVNVRPTSVVGPSDERVVHPSHEEQPKSVPEEHPASDKKDSSTPTIPVRNIVIKCPLGPQVARSPSLPKTSSSSCSSAEKGSAPSGGYERPKGARGGL